MREKFIVDGHCDTLLNLLDKSLILSNDENHVSLNKLKTGNVGIQFFAAWIGPKQRYGSPLQRGLKLIDRYHQMISDHRDSMIPILKYDDVNTISGSKLGTILAVEGGDILEGELANLRILYRLGVRLMTLTWNHRNEIGDGIMETESQGGLSKFGISVVKEMNQLGMIIDVSHLSPKGFWDTMAHSSYPVIASHSNVKALCSHPRNLEDEQIMAIADQEGLIGINFYPDFLSESEAGVDDIIKHIEYISGLVGVEAVGFGSDFDGIADLPRGIDGPQSFPTIINRLLQLNFTETDIEKIMYKNYLRVLKNTIR